MRLIAVFLFVLPLLAGCAMLGLQSSTLSLDRDLAMIAVGRATQACLDKKVPQPVCDEMALLLKTQRKMSDVDLNALIKLVGPFLPLLGAAL